MKYQCPRCERERMRKRQTYNPVTAKAYYEERGKALYQKRKVESVMTENEKLLQKITIDPSYARMENSL